MSLNYESIVKPELLLGDLLRKYAQGEIATLENGNKVLYRAVVLAVDDEGGRLSGPSSSKVEPIMGVGVDGKKRKYNRNIGPLNPKGAIKALIIDSARDAFSSEDTARIMWPFFPQDHMSLPVAPGEHVYTIFEDGRFEHGLWICRISGHDSANFMPGAEYYSAKQNDKKLIDLFSQNNNHEKQRVSDDNTTRVRASGKKLKDLF